MHLSDRVLVAWVAAADFCLCLDASVLSSEFELYANDGTDINLIFCGSREYKRFLLSARGIQG
jgi:hypothetical protein